MDNNDIYLTIFSPENPTSVDTVKTANLSEFSVELPHAINLNPNLNWECAVVQFGHPPCLYVSDERNVDVIRFREYESREYHEFNIKKFGEIIAESVYNPALYTREYLKDFYTLSNYSDFNSATNVLKTKYDTTAPPNTASFRIKAWPIRTAARKNPKEDSHWDLPHDFAYYFLSNVNYTLNQLIYSFLKQTYVEMTKKIVAKPEILNS